MRVVEKFFNSTARIGAIVDRAAGSINVINVNETNYSNYLPNLVLNFLQHANKNLRSLAIKARAGLLSQFLFPILDLVLDAGNACKKIILKFINH